MKILYDTIQKVKVGPYYTIEGKEPALPSHIIVIEQIDVPKPHIHRNEECISTYILKDGNYLQVWTVIPKNNWEHPHKIRIRADINLAFERLDLVLYKQRFDLLGLPTENDGEYIYLYCNEIVESDIYAIKSDPRIIVEGKDYETQEYLHSLGL